MLVGIVPTAAPAATAAGCGLPGAGPVDGNAGAFEQALAASVESPAVPRAAGNADANHAAMRAAQAPWLTNPASITITIVGSGAAGGVDEPNVGDQSERLDAGEIAEQDAATAMQMAASMALPMQTPLAALPAEQLPVATGGNPGSSAAAASGRSGGDDGGGPVAGAAAEKRGESEVAAEERRAGDAAARSVVDGPVADGVVADGVVAEGVAPQQPGQGEAAAAQRRAAAPRQQSPAAMHSAASEGVSLPVSAPGGNSSASAAAAVAVDARRDERAATLTAAGQRFARALGNRVQGASGPLAAAAGQEGSLPAAVETGAAPAAAAVVQNSQELAAATMPATPASPAPSTRIDLGATAGVVDASLATSTFDAAAQDGASSDGQSRAFAHSAAAAEAEPGGESLSASAHAFMIPPAAADGGKVASTAVAAAAAAPAPAPAEVPDAESAAALVDTIRLFSKPGIWEATVTLKPEHMGEVTINLTVERNNVSAVVRAESAGVREWLQANEGSVRTGLNEQGLQLTRFEVEEQEAQRRGNDQRRQQQQQPEEQRRRGPRRNAGETFEITV